MKNPKMLKNEKGFTLIEIITVIIIMGILAAVAVPKFFSMQTEAKEAALSSALSEASARFNNAFAKYILVTKGAPTGLAPLSAADYLGVNANVCTGEGAGVNIGDFTVCYAATGSALTITVLTASTIPDLTGLTTTKTISVVNWGS